MHVCHLVVLQMNRKLTWSNVLLGMDTYSVSVFPHVDYIKDTKARRIGGLLGCPRQFFCLVR